MSLSKPPGRCPNHDHRHNTGLHFKGCRPHPETGLSRDRGPVGCEVACQVPSFPLLSQHQKGPSAPPAAWEARAHDRGLAPPPPRPVRPPRWAPPDSQSVQGQHPGPDTDYHRHAPAPALPPIPPCKCLPCSSPCSFPRRWDRTYMLTKLSPCSGRTPPHPTSPRGPSLYQVFQSRALGRGRLWPGTPLASGSSSS